jgi:DNA-binding response OmpR family regulator
MENQTYDLLVLEDNPNHAELIMESLNEYHRDQFRVDHCRNEVEFFKHFNRKKYDGILIDYFLDGISGKDIVQKLKAKGCQVPLILISSCNWDEIAEEVTGIGADGFISKTQTSLKTLPIYLKRKLHNPATLSDVEPA